MTDQNREHLEQRLLEERSRTLRALGKFDERFTDLGEESDGSLTNYPLHQADAGTDTMESEKDFLLASNEGRQLIDIDRALRTLYKEPERYGICDACGKEIQFERLDLVPWARLCKEDKEAEERNETAPR